MAQTTASDAVRARYETPEYAAMMRRMLKAWGRRVADADPEDLAELIAARVLLDKITGEAIARMRTDHALSWSDIARAAGTSRQAAYERWNRYGQDRNQAGE
jgi:hypothetical protein